MISWVVLLVLLVAEIGGLVWWLRREFYPIFFSDFAALIYSAVLAADCILTWLVSFLVQPGGTFGTQLLAAAGVALLIIVAVFTGFFHWVISSDMTDPK